MKLLRKVNGNEVLVINEKDGLLYFSGSPKKFYYYVHTDKNKIYCWEGTI